MANRDFHAAFVRVGIEHPQAVARTLVGVAVLLALAVALPTIWPQTFPFLEPVKIDTDPENMLRASEPVRVFHDRMKRELSLYDMVVVGVVNEDHEDGVFNPESLRKIHALTGFAKTLRWPTPGDPERSQGVVALDMIAPSVVDNIEQAGAGSVRFEWLMADPPRTREEALAVREKAKRIPLFDGTMIASNGRAVALYLPLTSKDASYEVYRRLQERIDSFDGPEQFFITGLPVAEDTFGVEMFVQMAISAPLAMLVIFLLMFYFFRNLRLIVAPMIIALVSVIVTMGLLVVTGNIVHIMSSMIPIFIMPIAVLDSIHVLSEFFDRHPETRDRRETLAGVMKTLAQPMLFTTITSCAGFGSLLLTPIPPVQVFGLFVALGIAVAWLLTVTFVPAYVMLIPEHSLRAFGPTASGDANGSPLSRALLHLGPAAARHARPILGATVVAGAVAAWGVSLIEINDNPIRWFTADHPIRVADRVLNEHFGGTYMAYLALPAGDDGLALEEFSADLARRTREHRDELAAELPQATRVYDSLAALALSRAPASTDVDALLTDLDAHAARGLDAAEGWEEAAAWEAAGLFVSRERQQRQVFKRPDVLRYVETLSSHLGQSPVVGKTNGLPDIVKTVYRELLSGADEGFRIPDSANAAAQTLVTYQSSHRPQDLWHFVTPDYRLTSLWVQLKSGDNRDMMSVVQAAERFFEQNPPPVAMDPQWFGLTYINVVWQEKMVAGMRNAFLGSLAVVFVTMTLLFRSALWGLLSLIPLVVTIALIYGTVGIVGKDYDMPVAVLSSLALGLAVDFAIHFLARTRELVRSCGSWEQSVGRVFGEPARAIARNVIVISVGFTPLLIAPLIPYRTVGVLMASILVISGVATLVILPALVQLGARWLFRGEAAGNGPTSGLRYGRTTILLATALAGGAPAIASAEGLSVEQIVEQTNRVAYYQGRDGRARVKMTISDDRGRTRSRAFVIIRRDDELQGAPADQAAGVQRMYIYFRRPADVNKMAFLVWKRPAEEDDRWLYLPALDLVKRIAASDKRTSFIGSHFFYEDVSGRSPEEDHHELTKTTDAYYVVRNRPKDPTAVAFAHFDMWIHRTTFLPVRTEYFDASGERYRLYEALEVETVDGYATVIRSRMSDLRSGGNTLLEYDSVAYDLDLPEEVFTERYLRSPPNQYLR